MRQLNDYTWTSDEGMVFKRKFDGIIMGEYLQLGIFELTGEYDSIENYAEISKEDAPVSNLEKIKQRLSRL